MHFNAHTTVTIADKKLSNVVSIHAINDGHQLGATCELVVPLNSRIQYQDGTHDFLTAQSMVLFKVGDPINIQSSYDGYPPVTVFDGFIDDFIEGTPMTIKCSDYIYFFHLGIFGTSRVLIKTNKRKKLTTTSVGTSYRSITFKNLLQNIVDFVNDTIDSKTTDTAHVELVLPIPDFTLVNVTFAMMSPAAILEWLKKELGFNISLSGNKLYANIASNTTDAVIYRTDRNVLKSDLQKPAAVFQTYKIKAWFVRTDGTKDSYEIGDSNGQLREVYFYRVQRDQALYQKLATEALNKVKQMKYSGTLTTLLYPDVKLFMKASYTDLRYPDKNGNYVVTSIETIINDSGYRRIPKLAYLSDLNLNN